MVGQALGLHGGGEAERAAAGHHDLVAQRQQLHVDNDALPAVEADAARPQDLVRAMPRLEYTVDVRMIRGHEPQHLVLGLAAAAAVVQKPLALDVVRTAFEEE